MLSNVSPRRQRGLTLIELMIALVVGLIVIGAVITFTVSTIRAYGQNIASTKLTQELRTSMNVMVRELRRAGFDAGSVSRTMTGTSPSNFNTVAVNGSCVTYQYDRGDVTGATPSGSEMRALRFNSTAGTIEMKAGAGTVDCNGTTGWVPVTDPAVVQVTRFTPVIYQTRFCMDIGSTTPSSGPTVYQIATGSVRNLGLCLRARMRNDTTVARQIGNVVRVRAEDLQFVANSATACPASPAVDAMPTLAAFNTDCASDTP